MAWPVRFSTFPRVGLTFLELRDSSRAELPGHAPRSCSGSSTSGWVLACAPGRDRVHGYRDPIPIPWTGASVTRPAEPASTLCGDAAGTQRAGCGETLCHPREPPRSSRGSQARPSPAHAALLRSSVLAPIHFRLGSLGCTVAMINLIPGRTNPGTRQGITNSAMEPGIHVCEPGAWGLGYKAIDPPSPPTPGCL